MNWFLGFVMGLSVLLVAINRIMDVHQEAKRQQEAAGKVHTAEIIERYTSKEVKTCLS
jgi:sensor domain CHASE-containing protein